MHFLHLVLLRIGTCWTRSGRTPARTGALLVCSGILVAHSRRSPGALRPAWAHSGRTPARTGALLVRSGVLAVHSGRSPGALRPAWAHSGRTPARTGALLVRPGGLWSHSGRSPGALRPARTHSLCAPVEFGHILVALWAHSGPHGRTPGVFRRTCGIFLAFSGRTPARMGALRPARAHSWCVPEYLWHTLGALRAHSGLHGRTLVNPGALRAPASKRKFASK